MKTKVFLMMVLAAFLVAGVACSKEDKEPVPAEDNTEIPDPEGTVLVSVRNSVNGGSPVELPELGRFYIDEGNNFVAYDSNLEFCSVGKASGLGNVYVSPSFKGWASIVAVQEGHGYFVRIKKDNSYSICARLYVVKYISDTNNALLGAYVKYQSPVENATY